MTDQHLEHTSKNIGSKSQNMPRAKFCRNVY